MKLTRERLKQIIKEELQEVSTFNETSASQPPREEVEKKIRDFYVNSKRFRYTDAKLLDLKYKKHHKAYKMDEPSAWLKWPEHDEFLATIELVLDGEKKQIQQQVFSDDKGNVSLGQSM